MIDNKLYNITYTQKDQWGQVNEYTCNVVAESSSSAQDVIYECVNNVLYCKVNKHTNIHAISPRVLRSIAFHLYYVVKEEKTAAMTGKQQKPSYNSYVQEKVPVSVEKNYQLLSRKM